MKKYYTNGNIMSNNHVKDGQPQAQLKRGKTK